MKKIKDGNGVWKEKDIFSASDDNYKITEIG